MEDPFFCLEKGSDQKADGSPEQAPHRPPPLLPFPSLPLSAPLRAPPPPPKPPGLRGLAQFYDNPQPGTLNPKPKKKLNPNREP